MKGIFLAKAFTAMELPALHDAFQTVGFTFVDIGGRRDVVRELRMLARFAHYVTCEADRAELERVGEALEGWRQTTIVPAAIARHEGAATLYVTRKPGLSSLLPPDPEITRRFPACEKYEVVRSVDVPTLPLDTAAERYAFTDGCFLKLDTQGTELDILQSGERLLSGTLAVRVEVSFYPFYRGQPLFADVDAYLRTRGFALLSLQRTNLRAAGYSPDVYSRRVTAWAHCLYVREVPHLTRIPFVRLLGIALAFKYFDLAAALVDRALAERAIQDTEAAALRADVQRCAAFATRQAVQATPDADSLLSGSFRDHLQRSDP
jgi:FkbM family methyltransferase